MKDRDRNRDALLHAKKAMLPKQREALRGISGQQSSSINIGSYDVLNKTNRRDQAETRDDVNTSGLSVSMSDSISSSRKGQTQKALDNFDSYLPKAIGGSVDIGGLDNKFNKKERQYLITIKSLKLEIEKLRREKRGY